MPPIQRISRIILCLTFASFISVIAAFAQQATGSIHGQVSDQLGGSIVGATVTVVDQSGAAMVAVTNSEGIYIFNGLAPGEYILRAASSGFAPYENPAITVIAGQRQQLDIKLSVSIAEEKVVVTNDRPLSTDAESNADAVVLKGRDIDSLPDDPDDLSAALQAIAGPSGGPSGGDIYVDGFTGGRLPPKNSIREVRINQNPFYAENDRPGHSRIDILTKPGFDKLRGSAAINFNDESLNSRNPFAPRRADFQSRLYNFNLSGPINAQKASYFMDFQRREEDDNEIINATILNPATLNAMPFQSVILTPRRLTTISPRIDYAVNPNNTLIARYSYTRSSLDNAGVGGFSLVSRAFQTSNTEHLFQFTETAVLNSRWVNETRFQYIHRRNEEGDGSANPTISVLEAFTGGGPLSYLASIDEGRWELQNYTTSTLGRHLLRFGMRLRGVRLTETSQQNFNGTFTFAGGVAPQLDADNQIVLDTTGKPVLISISSIERFRRTVVFEQQGFQPAQVRSLGGGPSQFSISGGTPLASVKQIDFAGSLQDEWRIRNNFSLTVGLRYENQNNISSPFNVAPRIAFAWAPGISNSNSGKNNSSQPKFVIRGGFGIFYERFNENGTLQARRFNGINQQRYIVSNPEILDQVLFSPDGTATNVPVIASLTGSALPQVTNRVASNLQAPYTMMGGINIERQLPYNFTIFGSFFTIRIRHALILRNINAPLPGTFDPTVAGSGIRPLGTIGDIYQVESSGIFNNLMMVVGVRSNLNRYFSIFANYSRADVKSNTDCIFGMQAGCFPANSYDLSSEYGRVGFMARQSLVAGGSLSLPKLKVTLNPFVVASAGRPFNITTGRDNNGDGLFKDRPAFATASTKAADLRVTPYGSFDVNPAHGTDIIPRNFGEGPGYFTINLGISRTFTLDRLDKAGQAGGKTPSGASSGRPQMMGQMGAMGGGQQEGHYSLTMSINIQNLFNRTNLSAPVGNLASPLFGQSLATAGNFGGFGGGSGNPAAGNRRIQASIRFNF
jgi:hypothetical protein